MQKLLSLPMAVVTGFLFCNAASAEETQKPLEWLFVHTAKTAEVSSATTLTVPVARDIFAFTDRPNRQHGYMTAQSFATLWDAGEEDSFQADPPNAVLTWREGDKMNEVEIVITDSEAQNDGGSIVYTIGQGANLPGVGVSLDGVSLFIDGVCVGICGNHNNVIF